MPDIAQLLQSGWEILNSHFEAWLLIASGVIILGLAAWMLWRTGRSSAGSGVTIMVITIMATTTTIIMTTFAR
jgi:hypothetical protein